MHTYIYICTYMYEPMGTNALSRAQLDDYIDVLYMDILLYLYTYTYKVHVYSYHG